MPDDQQPRRRPQPLEAMLDALQIPQEAKADVFDAFHGAASPQALEAFLDSADLPLRVKAALFDLKFNETDFAGEEPPTPERGSVSSRIFGPISELPGNLLSAAFEKRDPIRQMMPNLITMARGQQLVEEGSPIEGRMRQVAGVLPFGPQAVSIADRLIEGDVPSAVGEALPLAAGLAAGPAASRAATMARGPITAASNKLFRSATGNMANETEAAQLLATGHGTLTPANLQRIAGTRSVHPRELNPQLQPTPRAEAGGQFVPRTRIVPSQTLETMADAVLGAQRHRPGGEALIAGKVTETAAGPVAGTLATAASAGRTPIVKSFLASRMANTAAVPSASRLEQMRALALSSLMASHDRQ